MSLAVKCSILRFLYLPWCPKWWGCRSPKTFLWISLFFVFSFVNDKETCWKFELMHARACVTFYNNDNGARLCARGRTRANTRVQPQPQL